MRRLLALTLLLAACSGSGTADTSTPDPTLVTTTSVAAPATSTTQPPPDCPAAPYELTWLPVDVGTGELNPDELEPDVWTSVPGTNTTFIPRSDDTVAIALIRGTLPAVDWPADKIEVFVDGTRGVVGPHPDGVWAAGWFEEPGERCDQYSMVFYPPWSREDVEQVLFSMNRVGG